MFKWVKILTIACVMALIATPVMAAEAGGEPITWEILSGTAFGCGLVILGAGYGIGRIGVSAVESMARQPEVAARIQTGMFISAALIEGVTFFALIVCMLTIFF